MDLFLTYRIPVVTIPNRFTEKIESIYVNKTHGRLKILKFASSPNSLPVLSGSFQGKGPVRHTPKVPTGPKIAKGWGESSDKFQTAECFCQDFVHWM